MTEKQIAQLSKKLAKVTGKLHDTADVLEDIVADLEYSLESKEEEEK